MIAILDFPLNRSASGAISEMMKSRFPRHPPVNRAQAELERGLALHRAGKFSEARAVYAGALRLRPGDADALRLTGSAFFSEGRLDEAVEALRQALHRQPNSAEAHYSLANALQARGELFAAVDSYREAVRLKPNFPEAFCNLGNAHAALEQWSEAASAFGSASTQRPGYAIALHNLAVACLKLDRVTEALTAARAATKADPSYVEAWLNLGRACEAARDFTSAIAAFREVTARQPFSAAGHYHLGLALFADHQPEAALAEYREVLRFEPSHTDAILEMGVAYDALEKWADARRAYTHYQALSPQSARAWNNIGTTFQNERRYEEASEAFRRSLALDPQSRNALNNLGIALWSQKRWPEAEAVARQLLALHPDDADGLNNLAIALTSADQSDEAEVVLRRALELRPDDAAAHSNWANLLLARGRPAEAIAEFRAARELRPDLHEARCNEGIAQLLTGEFRAGWANYEFRFMKSPPAERNRFAQPRWQGEPLAGKTILVHAEQGLGDTIQFARYLPLLAAQGARVLVEAQAPLKTLLESLPGELEFFVRGESLPPFDVHCPLLSLAHGFGTELATIPSATPYLAAPSEALSRWAMRFPVSTQPRVGVVWSGNPRHENDHRRSLSFDEFRPVLMAPGIEFFSLQKNAKPADAAALAALPHVTDLGSELATFADTAAVIAHLDVVIAVDTSVAHLAGALGKPVWVLLPFAPDWRWLLGRDDSPWYPSARLFRQPRIGDWQTVAAEVGHALAANAGMRRAAA